MSDTCPKHYACLPATCSDCADAFGDAFAKAFPRQSDIQVTHYPDCYKDSPPCAFTLGWNLAMDYIDSAGHEIAE